MAEIFVATKTGIEGIEKTVVLKRVLPKLIDNEEFITMFLDEARLLASLNHPNVAQVFDLDRDKDTFFIAMEYVRGPTLAELLRAARKQLQRPVPIKIALHIASQIGEALAYVHSRRDSFGRPLNVVHRDLNPSNIIVSYEGSVKLIDFGIAKAASKVYETRTGVIKGTYGYMAPEQLRYGAEVDHRVDIFALGVVLYEICTGKHPFDANRQSDPIQRLLQSSAKPPRQINKAIPRALETLIVSCLSQEPAHRPDSMDELLAKINVQIMAEKSLVRKSEVAEYVRSLIPDPEGPQPVRPPTVSKSVIPAPARSGPPQVTQRISHAPPAALATHEEQAETARVSKQQAMAAIAALQSSQEEMTEATKMARLGHSHTPVRKTAHSSANTSKQWVLAIFALAAALGIYLLFR